MTAPRRRAMDVMRFCPSKGFCRRETHHVMETHRRSLSGKPYLELLSLLRALPVRTARASDNREVHEISSLRCRPSPLQLNAVTSALRASKREAICGDPTCQCVHRFDRTAAMLIPLAAMLVRRARHLRCDYPKAQRRT